MVLLAMGFVGPEKTILEELTLAQDSRGNIDTSTVKYQTSIPRVYTAGGTSVFVYVCLDWKLQDLERFPMIGLVICQ